MVRVFSTLRRFRPTLNPILLRDLRQAVRNRLLMVLLCLLLTVLFLTLLYELVWEPQFLTDTPGQKIFNWLLLIVAVGSFVVTNLHVILRCVFDQVNEDPMYYALLTPGQIVRGRLLTALVLSCVTYSVGLPFMTLAYQLRGLDLNVALFLIVTAFFWTQVFNAVACAFFVGCRSYLGAVVNAVPYLLLMLIPGGYLVMISYFILFYGGGFAGTFDLQVLLIFVCIGTAIALPAYWFSVAQLIPVSADRMFRARRGLTLLVVLLPVVILACVIRNLHVPTYIDIREVAQIFTITVIVIGVIAFPVCATIFICERDRYPLRQRLAIPKTDILRLLRFPFSSGVANGMVWLLLMGAGWLLIIWWCLLIENAHNTSAYNWTKGVFRSCLTFFLFVFNYAVTARLLWQGLFKRWIASYYTWLLVFALLILICMPSYMLQFAVNVNMPNYGYHDRPEPIFVAASPFPYMGGPSDGFYTMTQTVCAFLWGVVLIILTSAPTLKRLSEYCYPSREELARYEWTDEEADETSKR